MLLNKKIFVAASALAVVTWCASPLSAQRGGGGGQRRGQEQGQSQGQARGGGERRAAPQTRPEAQRPAPQQAARPQQEQRAQQEQRPQQQAAPQRSSGAQARQAPQARPEAQRAAPQQAQRPQQFTQQAPAQRFGGSAQTRQAPQVRPDAQRPVQPQAQRPQQFASQQPQRFAQPRQSAPAPTYRNAAPTYRGTVTSGNRTYRAAQGYYTQRYYTQPHYVSYAYTVRRPVFVQPYYAFRPYFSLSFGIHVGYGVSYPFSYWDPYASYNYRLGIQPGYNSRTYYTRVGGLSFEIDPYDAEVYIDGDFVGYASDFAPEQMPLTLLAGRHRVELASPGYQDVSFDITVVAGQVIPYQGTLPYEYDR